MCCDLFDLILAAAGGFTLGCLVTGILAKKIMEELYKHQQWRLGE